MTDVFLICFSVVNPASFQNVREEWVPELQEYAPTVPYLLIGTQVSRYDNQIQIVVSTVFHVYIEIVLSIFATRIKVNTSAHIQFQL